MISSRFFFQHFWLLLNKSNILSPFRTKSIFRSVNRSKKKLEYEKNTIIGSLLLEHQRNLIEQLDELLHEAGLHYQENFFFYSHKKLLLNVSANVLKNFGLLNGGANLLQNLINQITDFPTSLTEDLLDIYSKNQEFTIRQCRTLIENKYLAWKFNVPAHDIQRVSCFYNVYFFQGHSLNSLQRNLKQLEKIKNIHGWTVAHKILFLNLIPCDEYLVEKCNEFPDILMWHYKVCRKPLWPHKVLTHLICTLKKERFNDEQIEVALKMRKIDVLNYFQKLYIILESDQLLPFREDNKFFYLLTIPLETLQSEPDMDTLYLKTVREVKDHSEIVESSNARKKKKNSAVWRLVLGSLNLTIGQMRFLSTHPNWLRCSEKELEETFLYLIENFSKTEIVESLPIILYPRSVIQQGLKDLEQRKLELLKAGFKNGYISNENLFSKGSRVENKRLLLCLYFLEKHFGVPEINEI